jgi:hypothetical protein
LCRCHHPGAATALICNANAAGLPVTTLNELYLFVLCIIIVLSSVCQVILIQYLKSRVKTDIKEKQAGQSTMGGKSSFARALRVRVKINLHFQESRRLPGKTRKRSNIEIFQAFATQPGRMNWPLKM